MAPRPRPDLDPPTSDMTPMIDVVFLMIVFFVCIDFRVLEAKLPAYLPRDVGGGPTVAPPQEQLHVRVHVLAVGTPTWTTARGTGRGRFVLAGHRAAWQIGSRTGLDQQQAAAELARIAADPEQLVVDARTLRRRLLPVVIEGTPDSRFDEIARTADLCLAAGFDDVQFAGGFGPRGG